MNSRNRDHNPNQTSEGLEAALIADLTDLHQVDVPALSFAAPQADARRAAGSFFSRHWRPSLIAAALAGVALFLGASSGLPGNETQGVSAEEILQRATVATTSSAASLQAHAYHFVAEAMTEAEKDGTERTHGYTTETWYGGPRNYRMEQRPGSQAQGLPADYGQSRNGDEVWLFNRLSSLKVVHGPASALDIGVSGQVLPVSDNLSELLATYNQPCMKASVDGETTVLDRSAYVIRVEFDASSCKDLKDAIKVRDRNETMVLTIDKVLFLPLVVERENAQGAVGYRYAVVQLDIDPVFDASTFIYQAPAGVSVVEVKSMSEAKMALAGVAPGQPASEACKVVLSEKSGSKEEIKAFECPPANEP